MRRRPSRVCRRRVWRPLRSPFAAATLKHQHCGPQCRATLRFSRNVPRCRIDYFHLVFASHPFFFVSKRTKFMGRRIVCRCTYSYSATLFSCSISRSRCFNRSSRTPSFCRSICSCLRSTRSTVSQRYYDHFYVSYRDPNVTTLRVQVNESLVNRMCVVQTCTCPNLDNAVTLRCSMISCCQVHRTARDHHTAVTY